MARQATATWRGELMTGAGHVQLGSGAFEGSYTFASRFQDGKGANPEELLGGALAGCFSMALANALAGAGYPATSVVTTAHVHAGRDEKGYLISRIDLVVDAAVPGVDEAFFQQQVKDTQAGCIIARALAATPSTVTATLTAV